MDGYTVGEVAGLAGVTVRTLHHYDEIGLLSPSDRTPSGYRRYDDGDVERLARILFYRELGFPLDQIASLMADGTTTAAHLRKQHDLLRDRIERLTAMAEAVEKELEAHKLDIRLTPEERLEVFGDFKPEEHEAEAERRWGGTDAYRESQRRASTYTADDWRRIKEESGAVTTALAAAMAAGVAADSDAATDLAEEHRRQINRWFYDCSYEIHVGLAEMYVADERFTAVYEAVAPGLAQYLHDAIKANAAKAVDRG